MTMDEADAREHLALSLPRHERRQIYSQAITALKYASGDTSPP
jgi:hypothetical protein